MVREQNAIVPFRRYVSMNRIWPKLKKLLYPGLSWVILLAVLGSVLLFFTFAGGLEDTPFA